jgi:predicted nucleic acid-binding protein
MATFVVDASVAVKWGLNESDSHTARRLTAHQLLAPPLLPYECANALWRHVRLGTVRPDQAAAVLAIIMEVKLIWLAPSIEQVLALAIAVDHPVYDCVYLTIAEAGGVPLITADKRLLNKTRSNRRLRRFVTGLGDAV